MRLSSLAVAAFAFAGCEGSTRPDGPGTHAAAIVSPNGAEGAAIGNRGAGSDAFAPSHITLERVVEALGLTPLPADEAALLDGAGNENGRTISPISGLTYGFRQEQQTDGKAFHAGRETRRRAPSFLLSLKRLSKRLHENGKS